MKSPEKLEIYRIIFVTVITAALFAAGIIIIRPFIASMLIGVIFSVATWPVFAWLESRLKKRTTLAATLMTFGLALCFVVPIALLSRNLASNYTQLSTSMIAFFQNKPDVPPAWVVRLPLIGPYAGQFWNDYINDTTYIADAMKDNLETISQQTLKIGAAIGGGIMDLGLGIFIAFFLFRHGKEGLKGLKVLLDRFIGPRAQRLLEVSESTMNGITYGLLGTALAQAMVAAIGFWIAGIPGAGLLALLILPLSPIPIGPPLVWVPATLWLVSQDRIGMAIFMFLWGMLAISAIDNVIRPWLISQGSKMPLLVVFLGALGGVFTFGFIGFFVGPMILAVIYVLILEEARIKA
ncbi:MAG: AI-2E family transporter [Alphaproteobacteria bacterium]